MFYRDFAGMYFWNDMVVNHVGMVHANVGQKVIKRNILRLSLLSNKEEFKPIPQK
jgi:hypothetical protein